MYPHRTLHLALLGCSHLEYTPYDSKAPVAANAIVAAEPTCGSARIREGVLMVWGRNGRLDLRYQHLAVRFDDGTSLALAALEVAVDERWRLASPR